MQVLVLIFSQQINSSKVKAKGAHITKKIITVNKIPAKLKYIHALETFSFLANCIAVV